MKQRFTLPISVLFFSLVLLTACSGKSKEEDLGNSGRFNPVSAPAGYEKIADVWNNALKASSKGDCETFLTLFTSDPSLETSDCAAAFSFLKSEDLEIDWESSEWNADKSKVKIYLTNGRVLSTFEIKTDETETQTGDWGIDMKFWEE